jgi:hypothetical protein
MPVSKCPISVPWDLDVTLIVNDVLPNNWTSLWGESQAEITKFAMASILGERSKSLP